MNIILLGAPGAGKGTQATLIEERYHIPMISTGNILRAAIQAETPLGKKAKVLVESGELVPDDIVIGLVKERIAQPDCQNGFLLDGFPRTVAQAEALDALTNIDCVVVIDVPEDDIVKRLTGRRIHPASGRVYHVLHNPPQVADKDDMTGEPLIQRADDSEETVRNRLSVYREQTSPLLKYYGGSHAAEVIAVDGTQPIDQVTTSIYRSLDDLCSPTKATK